MRTAKQNPRKYINGTARVGFADLDYRRFEPQVHVFHEPFDDSTSPEAIAEAQQEAVYEAIILLGREDIAGISDAVNLPTWSVERRIAKLYGEKTPKYRTCNKPPKPVKPRRSSKTDVIAAFIRQHGPSSAKAVAEGINEKASIVGSRLSSAFELFVVVDRVKGRRSGRPTAIYDLRHKEKK